jgi:hypothetical protein
MKAFYPIFSELKHKLCNSLTETKNMDAIITGNILDFSKSKLPVFRPSDFFTRFSKTI